jgi:hypothetical protein
MMKNYMTMEVLTKGKKTEGDPAVKATMSMYGGLVPMSPGVSSNIQVGSQRRKPGLLRVPSLV